MLQVVHPFEYIMVDVPDVIAVQVEILQSFETQENPRSESRQLVVVEKQGAQAAQRRECPRLDVRNLVETHVSANKRPNQQ